MNDDVLERIRTLSFDRNALYRHAERTGSGRGAIEKDLVISIVLAIISDSPEFSWCSDKLIFRGGTCIKKVFYHDETRFSEDIDLMGLNIEEAGLFMRSVNKLVGMNLGVTSFDSTEVQYSNERGLDFMLYYTSVLQQKDHISFNLSTAYPMERIQKRAVIVEPYLQINPSILTLGIKEILAEKTRALLQRRKPRDLFDVWFLIKNKELELDRSLLRKKLERSYAAAPFSKKEEASSYVMEDIISRIKSSVTDITWKNELGGLLMKPKPNRLVVVNEICNILSSIGDINVRK